MVNFRYGIMAQATEPVVGFTEIKISGVGDMGSLGHQVYHISLPLVSKPMLRWKERTGFIKLSPHVCLNT